jgi:hypothetical protein
MALFVPLVVLRPPRTGLLAVLWWAAILAFFILAAFYTIRTRFMSRRGNRAGGYTSPSQVMLWVVFLIVVAMVAVVLLALHIVPGT